MHQLNLLDVHPDTSTNKQSLLNETLFCRYESDETPMVSYLNVHDGLEQRRRAAKEASTSHMSGPRTIVSPFLS